MKRLLTRKGFYGTIFGVLIIIALCVEADTTVQIQAITALLTIGGILVGGQAVVDGIKEKNGK